MTSIVCAKCGSEFAEGIWNMPPVGCASCGSMNAAPSDWKSGPSAMDEQVGGDHYKEMSIQPIAFILANELGFIEGNVVKYVTRWRAKGGVEDLKKARHYLDLLIEHNNG